MVYWIALDQPSIYTVQEATTRTLHLIEDDPGLVQIVNRTACRNTVRIHAVGYRKEKETNLHRNLSRNQ